MKNGAYMKRLKLEKQKDNKKRIKVELTEEKINNKITEEAIQSLSKKFINNNCIGAVPSKYINGMGDRIEIYDLNSKHCVGAIYPDGACMIWPVSWWENRKDAFIPDDEFLYNKILYLRKKKKNKKKRTQLNNDFIPKRKLKHKKVQLNIG